MLQSSGFVAHADVFPVALDLDNDGALAVALKLTGDADNFGLFCDASAARSKASIDGPA